MHKISYDLPIGFYPQDFFFEKKNKDCVDFLSVKILTSLGRISTVGSKLPPLEILPHEVNILTSKKIQTNLVYLFKEKLPAVTHNW
jgi:hypothetical protein